MTAPPFSRTNTNTSHSSSNKKVVNISPHELINDEIDVLSKGLGFSIYPKQILFENIICGMEDSIQGLNDVDKEQSHHDFTLTMRKAKPPKSNLSNKLLLALKNLINNDNIIILKVDKGGATIIMDKEDYNLKMRDHLYSNGSYKKLQHNLISRIIKEVKKSINESNLDDYLRKRLTPCSEITPVIYGLLQIHKEGILLRTIVNNIGSPTYMLVKHVADILIPLVGNIDSFMKDYKHFVDLIKDEKYEPTYLTVRFDVVSLFTKIPLNEAIEIVKGIINSLTSKLVEICLI